MAAIVLTDDGAVLARDPASRAMVLRFFADVPVDANSSILVESASVPCAASPPFVSAALLTRSPLLLHDGLFQHSSPSRPLTLSLSHSL
jgi:hypothetical protein